MCPKGDDPLTVDQNYYKFQITVTGSSTLSGQLGIIFEGRTTYISLNNPSHCGDALQQGGSFGYVGCSWTYHSSTSYSFNITVYSWPTFPSENNLFSHNGNPPISHFRCDTGQASSVSSCHFAALYTTNVRGR